MPFALTVPNEYGYVLLTATATTFLAQYHGLFAGRYRYAAGIKHPNAYAPDTLAATKQAAYLFNCAQRAHANYIENQPSVLATLLIAGLRFPVVASALGVAWCVARVVYMFGYVSEGKSEGKGRYPGLVYSVPQLGLGALSAWVGWCLLSAEVGL